MQSNQRITHYRVQWHEGMLLSPHHFQQSDLYQHLHLHSHLTHALPYHWGVVRLNIDKGALVEGLLRILDLEAIMPDGLIITYDAASDPRLEIDLNIYKDTLILSPQKIFLSVVRYKEPSVNLEQNLPRYDSVLQQGVIDENTYDNPLSLPMLRPRLQLLTADDPNYVTLPLTEIMLKDNSFKVTSFIPPHLHVTYHSPLGEEGQNLVALLRGELKVIHQRFMAQRTQEGIESHAKILRVFYRILPNLEVSLHSQRIHPFHFYLHLCNLAGEVAGLNLEKELPLFPLYDHVHLYDIFNFVLNFIKDIIVSIESPYTVIPFNFEEEAFKLKLESDMIGPQLILGIRLKATASMGDMLEWIKGAVITTHSHLRSIKDRRILGAGRQIIEANSVLKIFAARDVILCTVNFEPEFMTPCEILYIYHPHDYSRERPAEIFLYVKK